MTKVAKSKDSGEKSSGKTVVFFHPDLGIGGAERLIIDAAVGLQKRGSRVVIFTSHCDPKHCFDEARDGSLDVRIRGNSIIPPSIFSRFSILCAILRQYHLILLIWFTGELKVLNPSAFFVDQLVAGVPLLGYFFPHVRTLFYCHFPDLLLAKGRQNPIKAFYRKPFDAIEAYSMSFADSVAVNSGFTKSVVAKQWPRLAEAQKLEIVYPCVDVSEEIPQKVDGKEKPIEWNDTNIILSINRFEEKKNVGLAIKAFAGLPKHARRGVRLVLAGGYDQRVQENVIYHQDLLVMAEGLGLKTASTGNIVTALNVPDDVDVLFLLSVPASVKDALLKSARLLVYTPSNEHFGIVPLEAMLVGTPVLAANTGGPLETVVEGETGWLRDPEDVESWTNVMNKVLHMTTPAEREKMAVAGKKRVHDKFSEEKMAEVLDNMIDEMMLKDKVIDTEGFNVLMFTLPMIALTLWALIRYSDEILLQERL